MKAPSTPRNFPRWVIALVVVALGLTAAAPSVSSTFFPVFYASVSSASFLSPGSLVSFGIRTPPPPCGPIGTDCLGSNIGRRAFVDPSGQHVTVAGPVRCTRGERVTLRITLTQRPRTAFAQVGLSGPCPGALRRYQSTLSARVGRFAPGSAFACLLGTTDRRGKVADVNQWCRNVILVAGPPPAHTD